jgi:hypothetical protein
VSFSINFTTIVQCVFRLLFYFLLPSPINSCIAPRSTMSTYFSTH